MSQVLREAYQLRLGFFVVQRFTKNSLVLNMHGSLSAEMSHQSDAMSHHFWKNVTSKWSNVTSLLRKCHIKVKQCHITFEYGVQNVTSKWSNVTSLLRKCHIKVKHCHITLTFLGIFGTRRVYLGVSGGDSLWPEAFCHTKCVSGEAGIQCFKWLMASGGGKGERTLVYWKSRFHLQVICLN